MRSTSVMGRSSVERVELLATVDEGRMECELGPLPPKRARANADGDAGAPNGRLGRAERSAAEKMDCGLDIGCVGDSRASGGSLFRDYPLPNS